jgi:hypothetical protein
MADDDYEIMPRKEIAELKKEIESLKRGTPSSRNTSSPDSVSANLAEMVKLFREATEAVKTDDEEQELIINKLGPINDKLDKLIDQNKKIAEGIIAVAEMLDERLTPKKPQMEQSEPKEFVPQQSFPQYQQAPPQFPSWQQAPPQQMMRPYMQQNPLPPPPSFAPDGIPEPPAAGPAPKKGLFKLR